MADGTTISAKIANIQSSADTIKTWLVEKAKITVASPQKLANSAAAISAIPIKTDIAATTETPEETIKIDEGVLFKVEPGYYPSALYIENIKEADGLYTLGTIDPRQAKTYRPSDYYKEDGSVYLGFTAFTVGEILPPYVNVTAPVGETLATSDQVLEGYYAGVMGDDGDSTLVEGTMPYVGNVTQILTIGAESYIIPEGYHDGNGSVYMETEEKSATPKTTSQVITPSVGKVLSKVTVGAIPNQKTAVTAILDANETFIEIPAGYYTSPSSVSINATTATFGIDLTDGTDFPEEDSWPAEIIVSQNAPSGEVYTSVEISGPPTLQDLRMTTLKTGLVDSEFNNAADAAITWGEQPIGQNIHYLTRQQLARFIPEGVTVGFVGTKLNPQGGDSLTWDFSDNTDVGTMIEECYVTGAMQNKGNASYDVMNAEKWGFAGEPGYYNEVSVNTLALYNALEEI